MGGEDAINIECRAVAGAAVEVSPGCRRPHSIASLMFSNGLLSIASKVLQQRSAAHGPFISTQPSICQDSLSQYELE
jgi:hypothetical protein